MAFRVLQGYLQFIKNVLRQCDLRLGLRVLMFRLVSLMAVALAEWVTHRTRTTTEGADPHSSLWPDFAMGCIEQWSRILDCVNVMYFAGHCCSQIVGCWSRRTRSVDMWMSVLVLCLTCVLFEPLALAKGLMDPRQHCVLLIPVVWVPVLCYLRYVISHVPLPRDVFTWILAIPRLCLLLGYCGVTIVLHQHLSHQVSLQARPHPMFVVFLSVLMMYGCALLVWTEHCLGPIRRPPPLFHHHALGPGWRKPVRRRGA